MAALQTGFKVTTSIGCTSMSAATMDISLVTLSPEAEQSYLSDPRRTFYYDEVQYVKIDSTPTTEEQSVVLNNNLSRLMRLVICPYAVNGNSTASPSDLISPFSGFGGPFLLAPMASITDFNVYLSGANVFHNNLSSAREFFNEWQRDTLNGGYAYSLNNNSMVSYEQWAEGMYGAISVNLTKITEPTFDLGRSVQVKFRNNSGRTMAYACFIYYERVATVDCSLGNLVP
jgi:hypothetical protein